MSRKKKKPKSEDQALRRFCQSVEIEEISFESWEGCHTDLDLRVPCFLTLHAASQGCEHPLKFSRSVDSVRKPTTHLVSFPPGIQDGHEVRVCGLGDEANGKLGDLIVIVRIKA